MNDITKLTENSNLSKSNFLSWIIHEIRTPLNAIIGISQVQLQRRDLQKNIKDDIEKIYSSGIDLLGIVNTILDIYKIETETLEIHPIESEIARHLEGFSYKSKNKSAHLSNIPEPMSHGKVLVVDDIETNLYVAEAMLALYELEIDIVQSGFEAIEKIESGNRYDIIFMDHMMPHMDGIQTTQKLRQMGYNRAIVALTANATIGSDKLFKQYGFDDFISKPIDGEYLNTILTRHIP